MTKIVAIFNLTPDSFFDGGKYNEEEKALDHLQFLLQQNVDVIDVGAESTRPNATPITPDQEWLRLQDILPKIIHKVANHNKESGRNTEVSLDSRHPQNIARALDLAPDLTIDVINDVSGFDDPEMIKLAAKSGKKIILMHNLGVPALKDKIIDERLDVTEVLLQWANEKLKKLLGEGVKKEQIIFDIGIGFGKNSWQSIRLLEQIDRFRILGLPIYVGHSNKSFLDDWNDGICQSRAEKTKAISSYLISKNIEYLRVHLQT